MTHDLPFIAHPPPLLDAVARELLDAARTGTTRCFRMRARNLGDDRRTGCMNIRSGMLRSTPWNSHLTCSHLVS